IGNWKQPFKIVRRENLNIPNVISNGSMVTTYARNRFNQEPTEIRIVIKALIGNGAFGRVYKAQLRNSEETVALKHSYYNARYQQREVEIMTQLENHCNIVKLIMFSYIMMGNPPRSSILLIMEYMPMNMLDYIKRYRNFQQPKDAIINIRILTYQMFRGLGYLHSLKICHRDIKPENMVMDSQSMQLKIADFGNAKNLEPQKRNLSYVGSRQYRAPELYAKYDLYDCSIDIWSAGCVLAELLKGSPLFLSNHDELAQLHHVVDLLGTEGLDSAPYVRSKCDVLDHRARPSWDLLLNVQVPRDLSDLLNSCMVYDFTVRILPMVACAHVAFDELRVMDTLGCRMPNGQKLPQLFNFDDKELGKDEKLRMDLLPLHLSEMKPELEKTDVAAKEDV
ncbi:hypothetical protein KR200_000025, partial [Drosophila serrata]